MDRKIQNWAFVAPKMSRDLSEYFEGILDFIKDDPSIFLHAFTFADSDIGTIADMDGVISYTVPPPEVMSVFRKSRPPIVAITMCRPTDPRICAPRTSRSRRSSPAQDSATCLRPPASSRPSSA